MVRVVVSFARPAVNIAKIAISDRELILADSKAQGNFAKLRNIFWQRYNLREKIAKGCAKLLRPSCKHQANSLSIETPF